MPTATADLPEGALVEMRGITKLFGRTRANDQIDLTLRRGEVHALLGENGAGKSTLMNILYGRCLPAAGEIFIRGVKTIIDAPRTAIRCGIGMVHQHFLLVQAFTALENIILGREPLKRGRIDLRRAQAEVAELARRYGLAIDPQARIGDSSVAMRQKVEILKALYRKAEVLILDEPTAVLSPAEVDGLVEIVRELALQGKSVVLITHKLKEVMRVADVCTILRNGRRIATFPVAEASAAELAEKMIGHRLPVAPAAATAQRGPVTLRVEDLYVNNGSGVPAVRGLSLEVHAGEILGIVGVDGNGQSELVEAIAGLRRITSGRVVFRGRELTNKRPREIIESGLGLIPEDRQQSGLVLDLSVAENLVLKDFRKPPFSWRGLLDSRAISTFAREIIRSYDIRPSDEDIRAAALSGGNQQKIVLAREIARDPELLVAVQPTRGLDPGSAAEIHGLLAAHRNRGRAILLVSFDLDEAHYLADRIAVIFQGRIVGILESAAADNLEIGLLMSGGGAG